MHDTTGGAGLPGPGSIVFVSPWRSSVGSGFFAEGQRPDGSSRGSGIRRTIRSSRYYRLFAAMVATCNIMYVTSYFLNARNAARAFVILATLVALVFATISIMTTPTTAIISPTNHTDF
jgi:hypothetical protein